MTQNILVFGRNGQLATELRTCAGVTALGRQHVDLENPEACAEAILETRPPGVINAAAYTDVDRAEQEEDLATRINAQAPAAMAQACARLDIPFVQLSTDYVFGNSKRSARLPGEPTTPLSAYGRSKLAGEEAVRRAGGRHVILRTSWVFSAHGRNFVKTMLRLAATREQVAVVCDQIGGPTPARALADACLQIVQQLAQAPEKTGTYHFSGAPDVSWADFARRIFAADGRTMDVQDIPTSAYPTPAVRPLNSELECSLTQEVFAIERPDWRVALTAVLDELKEARND